ncbi:MAG: malate synthase G [Pseudomonadota bacterium]|jgi:malate synthase|nr:malate synthase G [Pseudomonadota bacterium]
MSNTTSHGGLTIATELYDFVNDDLLRGAPITTQAFWDGFDAAVQRLAPKNADLLSQRGQLQRRIDSWLRDNASGGIGQTDYEAFLTEIGYLCPEGPDFAIDTANVDDEIAKIAGPQLVVPVTNARYALNAANARWGSLYDALYGTDAISEDGGADRSGGYNPVRGAKVIAYVRGVLDDSVPLAAANWDNATGFSVVNGELKIATSNGTVGLADASQFVGHTGAPTAPDSIILINNSLHFEIVFDDSGAIGNADNANIDDVLAESALTSIIDLEDSIAAVDAEDKVLAYRNWLELMRGTLTDTFEKGGKSITRKLNGDKPYIAANGQRKKLRGRALMLVRNVGHLMSNPAITMSSGEEIPEGIMDAFMTVAGALPDFADRRNSLNGSIYIVKPKLHGPEEVAFAVEIFEAVEDLFNLTKNTIKIGIMDEERRTTVNLKECIRAAKSRVAFINTGFLDRTGDEIHTSMDAGAMIRKGDMKASTWIGAYEDWNVDIGLACGFGGRAQIGKGMWAMPDMMAAMMEQKIGHPQAGANTAWVPSPTAATLHALHYHKVDVFARQAELASRNRANRSDVLTVPVASRPNWNDDDIRAELRNNAQGILGYVVRWIDQGVGCSKVPDIYDIGLMEDRATLRISSQHIANWLYHGVCNEALVMDVMKEMATVVDRQNSGDPAYQKMAGRFDESVAFKAACDLVFKGREQPSGYTEPILHARRLEKKAEDQAA